MQVKSTKCVVDFRIVMDRSARERDAAPSIGLNTMATRSTPRGDSRGSPSLVLIVGFIASLLAVLLITFPWQNIVFHSHWARVVWIPFSAEFRPVDVFGNVLIFVPLGFTTTLMRRRQPLAAVFLLAFVTSLTAEALQLYSHSRYPSATDVVCNVAGALLGFGAAYGLDRRTDGTHNLVTR
jgi:glycopeptide antibiotics resistance protein